jgi:hypothetical protein
MAAKESAVLRALAEEAQERGAHPDRAAVFADYLGENEPEPEPEQKPEPESKQKGGK